MWDGFSTRPLPMGRRSRGRGRVENPSHIAGQCRRLFVPKSIVCLREGYTREKLLRDLIAGVVVGIVALPLALAFAIASGVPPERGLYTAIIAGFIISELVRWIYWTPAGVALGEVALLVIWPRISSMIPAPFVAMVLATIAVQIFNLPVETIGSRFGAVPSSLPAPHLPAIQWMNFKQFIPPSLTIALLAAIESLLS